MIERNTDPRIAMLSHFMDVAEKQGDFVWRALFCEVLHSIRKEQLIVGFNVTSVPDPAVVADAVAQQLRADGTARTIFGVPMVNQPSAEAFETHIEIGRVTA